MNVRTATAANGEEFSMSADCIDARTAMPLTYDDHQVCTVVNFSPSTLRRMWERGDFPAPKKIGALNRWSRAEVEEWWAKQPHNGKPRKQPQEIDCDDVTDPSPHNGKPRKQPHNGKPRK